MYGNCYNLQQHCDFVFITDVIFFSLSISLFHDISLSPSSSSSSSSTPLPRMSVVAQVQQD